MQLPVTSSVEPRWPSGAQQCYRDVLKAFNSEHIPYAVGGAFAMHKHTSIWRETKDLDLMLVADIVPRALEAARRAGFEAYIEDPVWLAKVRRGDYFVDLITGVGNAALIVDQSWIDRAVPDKILDFPCRILGAEELLAAKVFVARRERFDGSDVAHLIRYLGRQLDWDRLLALLSGHWSVLFWSLAFFAYVYPSRTDLVPERIWNELTRHFEQSVKHPRKGAPFRGSLIDPNMFAIDVDERGERNLYQENCEQHPHLLSQAGSAGSEE